ncbi:MAG: hypothetical protein ACTFAK_14020 [Candidatus Electronema sp. VV]
MNRTTSAINIRQDLLQKICLVAEQQHLKAERLVSSILEQYLQNFPASAPPSPDASFLLSMAGMFSGNEGDASEHVQEIVSDYIAGKHAQESDS